MSTHRFTQILVTRTHIHTEILLSLCVICWPHHIYYNYFGQNWMFAKCEQYPYPRVPSSTRIYSIFYVCQYSIWIDVYIKRRRELQQLFNDLRMLSINQNNDHFYLSIASNIVHSRQLWRRWAWAVNPYCNYRYAETDYLINILRCIADSFGVAMHELLILIDMQKLISFIKFKSRSLILNMCGDYYYYACQIKNIK